MKQIVQQDIKKAIESLQHQEQWPRFEVPSIVVEVPQEESHGDFATNIAMQLARVLKKSPIQIAEQLKEQLPKTYQKIELVKPGFINFFLDDAQFNEAIEQILQQQEQYGRSTVGNGQKVMLEFISANPTGPLTLPNGRGGYLGDVLANVFTQTGHTVVREYYFNDQGRQVDILGESVLRRYLQLQGKEVTFDEELYQGAYISDLAKKLSSEIAQFDIENEEGRVKARNHIKRLALEYMFDAIKTVIREKMRIQYDSWFSEQSLYDQKIPEKMLQLLKEKDAVYEKDGAVWLKTSAYGDEKDRVLIKSSGQGAYIQGDVALFYHRAFVQEIQKIILVLGADHHGYQGRLKALPQLLAAKTTLDIIFTQMATLMKNGEEIRMSKRKGNFVTIEELIDEVGNDAARFFFLMYSADRHMNFDLDLAKEQSDKNPVYYVQYAHARMCSIMREVEKIGTPEQSEVHIEHQAEKAVVKQLIKLPDLLLSITESYEAHHLTTYALDCARAFHHFYGQCRVIENGSVNASRLALVRACQIVLNKTLHILGVNAPERM